MGGFFVLRGQDVFFVFGAVEEIVVITYLVQLAHAACEALYQGSLLREGGLGGCFSGLDFLCRGVVFEAEEKGAGVFEILV